MIGDFEVEIDGACLLDGLACSGLRKGDFGHYGVLLISGHFLDEPLDGIG